MGYTDYYELLKDDFIIVKNSKGVERKLFRVKATKTSLFANRGDLGGYIASTNNLQDMAWCDENSIITEPDAITRGMIIYINTKRYDVNVIDEPYMRIVDKKINHDNYILNILDRQKVNRDYMHDPYYYPIINVKENIFNILNDIVKCELFNNYTNGQMDRYHMQQINEFRNELYNYLPKAQIISEHDYTYIKYIHDTMKVYEQMDRYDYNILLEKK